MPLDGVAIGGQESYCIGNGYPATLPGDGQHLFLISSMIVPGSIYWSLGVGRDKGEVLGDDETMRNMSHRGQTIAWLGAVMAATSNASPFPNLAI